MGPIAVVMAARWKQRARWCSIANKGENGLGLRQQLTPDKQRGYGTRRVNRKILRVFIKLLKKIQKKNFILYNLIAN